MALILIQPIKDLSYINIQYLKKYYPNDVYDKSKVFFIISRIFNDQIKEVDLIFDIPFEREVLEVKGRTYGETEYYLKISDIVEKYHIAKDYYLELIIRFVSNKGKIKTVFPGEIRSQGLEKIHPLPEDNIKAIIKFLEPHEITTKLASLNYSILSDDLLQSIKRFDSGDYDGSIKFSRKVVEGIKQLNFDNLIKESNRQDKVKAYLGSSFSLLSNFGEHTGTTASEDEALLAKDIALGLSTYIVSKHNN